MADQKRQQALNEQARAEVKRKSIKGLPMFTASAPEELAKEKAELAELAKRRFPGRCKGYFSKTGPGWMQSALTLGGGSAMASLFAGAFLQYKLLWVQPIAMLFGIIMLSAVSYQTLTTGTKPFYAMKHFIHPAMAWTWALASIVATIIWHLPQYALAAGMTNDMIKAVTRWEPTSTQQTLSLLGLGFLFLGISTAITWNYSKGQKGIRLYEKMLKWMVWMIIFAFLVVVVRRAIDGGINWRKVLGGFVPTDIPTDRRTVSMIMGAFGAAVGINMTFLFPYSLLARGWSKEHKGLSRFDLLTGMFLPYFLATSLMIIATGCTIYDPEAFASGGTMLPPIQAARMLEAAGLGIMFSRIIFGLGILGMALSTITLHMLLSGFAVCELFGVEPGGWRYRLGCLIPAPAVFGVVLWSKMGPWIAIPASAICGLMLPVAYIAFFILNNSKRYLGQARPTGAKAFFWNAGMLLAILASLLSASYYLFIQFFT